MQDVLPDAERNHELVLVADDETEARKLLRRILEREHFRVEEAVDGRMTVEKARDLLPDLIFLDIQMPGIDGFEAVQLLRRDARTERIPIIVVSAAAREPRDVARGLGLGADDYLRKPYDVNELLARARSNLRARQLEERLQQRTEELEALIRIGSELNEELELDEMADRVLAATLGQLTATSAILVLKALESQPTLARYQGVDISSKARLLASNSLPGYVMAHGEATVINDIADEERVSIIFVGASCVTGIAAPLKHRGEVLGVLALGDDEL